MRRTFLRIGRRAGATLLAAHIAVLAGCSTVMPPDDPSRSVQASVDNHLATTGGRVLASGQDFDITIANAVHETQVGMGWPAGEYRITVYCTGSGSIMAGFMFWEDGTSGGIYTAEPLTCSSRGMTIETFSHSTFGQGGVTKFELDIEPQPGIFRQSRVDVGYVIEWIGEAIRD